MVLLCSRNSTVLNRWLAALVPAHTVYQTSELTELTRILEKQEIKIVLLHRSMVDAEQIQALIGAYRDLKLFILADRPENSEGLACLSLGCVGYANAYSAPAIIGQAVKAILSGLVWTGPTLMQYLIRNAASHPGRGTRELDKPSADRLAELSKREFQVAQLVAEGLTNKSIAAQLAISERTVKAHLSAVYQKTGVTSRIGLAKLLPA